MVAASIVLAAFVLLALLFARRGYAAWVPRMLPLRNASRAPWSLTSSTRRVSRTAGRVGWKLEGNGWQFDVDAGMVTLEGSVPERHDVADAGLRPARTPARDVDRLAGAAPESAARHERDQPELDAQGLGTLGTLGLPPGPYLALLMLAFPLVLYLPTHALLARLASDARS